MERLEQAKQAEIKKMSTVKLTSRLLKAGVSAEEMETMDRPAMLERWAELVATGNDEPGVATAAAAEMTAASRSVELELQRLQIQQRQLELEERKEAAAARWLDMEAAAETQRLALEAQRLDLEGRRREADEAFQREQLQLLGKQIKMQEDRDARDHTAVSQLKKFGDALRNSVNPMGNDPMELILFFDNLERQFDALRVPGALYVSLMKPFLNDRARSMLNRLDSTRVADYKYVKQFLIEQFRLVPQYFLDTFNGAVRQSSETARAFVSRMSLLLDHYLRSRGVTNFEGLKRLLISDRIKASLPEWQLGHVLRVETTLAKKYAEPDELAETLDTLMASHDKDGKPRASALGVLAKRPNFSHGYESPYNTVKKDESRISQVKGRSVAVNDSASNNDVSGTGRGSTPPARTCYTCGSSTHLRRNCPKRVSTDRPNTSTSLKQLAPARINRCVVDEPTGELNAEANEMEVSPTGKDEVLDATVSCMACTVGTIPMSSFYTASEPPSAIEKCDTLELAPLPYLRVRIDGIIDDVICIADSGTEINLIDSNVVCNLNPDVIGRAQIRGIVGNAVTADLIKLQIRLSDDVDEKCFADAVFAVCANVNESCILSMPTVNMLVNKANNAMCTSELVKVSVDGMKAEAYDRYAGIANSDVINVNAVVTRSQAKTQPKRPTVDSLREPSVNDSIANVSEVSIDTGTGINNRIKGDDDSDNGCELIDVDAPLCNISSELGASNAHDFAEEQRNDVSLGEAWKFARDGKAGYSVREGLLYHQEFCGGNEIHALVMPEARRLGIIRLAHSDSHFSSKKTLDRIISSGLHFRLFT